MEEKSSECLLDKQTGPRVEKPTIDHNGHQEGIDGSNEVGPKSFFKEL